MPKLLECVPNFSEGTDTSVVEEIISAVKAVKVQDLHSDPDHNRSVATFWGEPEAVQQAAFELTERAMQLLDIREHNGAHPFIGVVDVIPFIPLQDASMPDTTKAAHTLGKRLWQELKLPVYYYGEAAKIPERKDLPCVRKGGFSVLKSEIDQPHRMPDEGKGLHQTAGAVAVGAREILIAYNVNLHTNDLSIAQSIARNIREKNGGLPGVRAIGLDLQSRGITQVSINIIDYRKATLKDVFDEVKKWAKEYEVEMLESEIVGLIPASALFEGMKQYLKLKNFSENKIIENSL